MAIFGKSNVFLSVLTGGYLARTGRIGYLFKKSPLLKRIILQRSALGLIPSYYCNQQCGYCKYDTLEKEFPDIMSIETFKAFLDWMKKAGLNSFRLLGGEPTQYPYLKEMITLARKRGFHISQFFSNLLCDQSVMQCFDRKVFSEIVAHYQPREQYRNGQYEVFTRNLKDLVDKGLNVNLKYTVIDTQNDYKEFIHLAKHCRIRKATLGFTHPGVSSESLYVSIKEMPRFNSMVVDMVKQLSFLGIKSDIHPALPLCVFGDKERKYLMRKTNLRGLCFGAGYLLLSRINPDLSVFLCPAIYQKANKSLLDFKSLEELYDYWEPTVSKVRWAPVMKECAQCGYFKDRSCQGGCLSYKIAQNFRCEIAESC